MHDWNSHLKEIMDRTEFMALSTTDSSDSWICPLQFSYDAKFNLYFKSMPGSLHMTHLLENPNVSIAIYSTDRLEDRNVAGIQLKGRGTVCKNRNDVEEAAKYHYNRSGTADYKDRIDEHLGEDAEWNFVRIEPTEAWCFDTRHFGEERKSIPLNELNLDSN